MKPIWIQHAKICDGTGEPAFEGSLWVEEGKIRRIWKSDEEKQEDFCGYDLETCIKIDADGRFVTPGFVDIHRHCDTKPFSDPTFGDVLLTQGITTTVVGNCGISLVPCPKEEKTAKDMYEYYEAVLGTVSEGLPKRYDEYVQRLKECPLPVHMAAMIGMGTVKIAVKGFLDTAYTKQELERAETLIREAMQLGAPGVSLGILYLPECYTRREEFVSLLKPVGELGGVAAVHIRGEGDSLVESVKEVIEIAAEAGCSLEISHFKSCGIANWNREIHRAIRLIEEARAAGQDVSCDFYPYEGGATTLTTMLPPDFIKGDLNAALQRLGTAEGVEAFRHAVSKSYSDWDNYAVSLGWDRILISGVSEPEHRSWLGRNLAELADSYGYKDAVAAAAHLLYTERGKTAIINLSMCQEDIDTIAALPYSSVISDSIYTDTDTPHPRLYGSFPKILREYVKERNVLSLPEAIRKMTWLPAQKMGLLDRGRIAEGYPADLNIFDLNEFRDHATFQNPACLSSGLAWCIVGGQIVVRDGNVIKRDAGSVLYRQQKQTKFTNNK